MNVFACPECRQGLMDPVSNLEEPEYTDRYHCRTCGHQASIPSLVVIAGQIFTAFFGALVALYLLLDKLQDFLTALQFGLNSDLYDNLMLVLLAGCFIAGFAYTLFSATRSILYRRRYLFLR